MKNFKRTVAAGLSAALVLTCVGIEPTRAESAAKAPQAAPAQAYTGPTDVSSRRRTYHRGVSPGQAAAMFAAVAGTVIAVSQARRYRRHYGVPYGYGAPYGGYYGAPYAYQPYGYGYGYGPGRW